MTDWLPDGTDLAFEAGGQVRFDLIINDQDARDKGQSRHTLWSSASASRHTEEIARAIGDQA